MGMFDTIEDELFCPFCGTKNNDFQTKDLSDTLDDWKIKDIKRYINKRTKIKIYDRCKKCKKWIEIIIEGEQNEK